MPTCVAPEMLTSACQLVIGMILQASWFWPALLAVASVTQFASSQGAIWILLRNARTVKNV